MSARNSMICSALAILVVTLLGCRTPPVETPGGSPTETQVGSPTGLRSSRAANRVPLARAS